MKNLVLAILLASVHLESAYAEKANAVAKTRGVAVAFFDQERLQGRAGGASLDNFAYFFSLIREVIERDFPGVELKILGRGELLRLPDGTGLNVQTIGPELGFVLSTRGKKRRVLPGVQSEADFACAASAFFQRRSPACPR